MRIRDGLSALASGVFGRGGGERAGAVGRGSVGLREAQEHVFMSGAQWSSLAYGEYYLRSAVVYAAIKARQDAIARLPLRVLRRVDVGGRGAVSADVWGRQDGSGVLPGAGVRANGEPVGAGHPLQRLLDMPNPFWSRGDLWRATETYLSLWGAAFWGLERGDDGVVAEIWPLRPDRMRVVPDEERYIKGFVFVGSGGALVPYVPEDVVWMRYFNPLDEYAGLSPIAPLRQSADMGMDALRANRRLLQNDSAPGLIVETSDYPTDAEVKSFYQRWEERFQGVDRIRRPALLGPGMKAANLGFSPRDMEYVQSLRWSLEDISRVFGVPKVMIGDLENTTFSNFSTARRLFWEDTIASQLDFYEEALRQYLVPHFGDGSLLVEFDVSGVDALKESEESKAKRRQLYVDSGIMTVDEVRREMNLPSMSTDNEV